MIRLTQNWFFQHALVGRNLRLAKNVVLTIERGLIVDIQENRKSESCDYVLENSLAIPSFINSHTHLGDSVAKEAAWSSQLDEAVGKNGIKFKKLEEKKADIPKAISNSIQNMILTGTSSFIDFREGGLEGILLLKKAVVNTPIRGFIYSRPIDGINNLDKIITNSDGIGLPNTTIYSDHELIEIKKSRY